MNTASLQGHSSNTESTILPANDIAAMRARTNQERINHILMNFKSQVTKFLQSKIPHDWKSSEEANSSLDIKPNGSTSDIPPSVTTFITIETRNSNPEWNEIVKSAMVSSADDPQLWNDILKNNLLSIALNQVLESMFTNKGYHVVLISNTEATDLYKLPDQIIISVTKVSFQRVGGLRRKVAKYIKDIF